VVEVSLAGLAPADSRKGFKTRPCRGKGLAPSWKSENSGRFRMIVLPELAMLYISVTDATDKSSLGHAAIPLLSLAQGYRHIALNVCCRFTQFFNRN
jgi:hypothetical protein